MSICWSVHTGPTNTSSTGSCRESHKTSETGNNLKYTAQEEYLATLQVHCVCMQMASAILQETATPGENYLASTFSPQLLLYLLQVKEYARKAKEWRNEQWPEGSSGSGRPSSYLMSLLVVMAYERNPRE